MGFLIGFLSAWVGFALSPERILENQVCALSHVSFTKCLVFCISIGLVSLVNGCNERMLARSRSDYFINVFIVSLFGVFIATVGFYIFAYTLIGRWVVFKIVLAYNVLFWVVSFLKVFQPTARVVIAGFDIKRFSDVASDIGLKKINQEYEFKEIPVDSVDGLKSDDRFICGKRQNIWIVFGDRTISDLNHSNYSAGSKLVSRILSVDFLIEKELEVVRVESVQGLNWWNLSTRLRFDDFVFLKRVVDLNLSMVILVVSLPVFILAGLAVKLADGGPVFYKQRRVGQYGREFWIYKIRTMRIDSEKHGAVWAKVSDPRVTSIGWFLRRSRIDELPQIWNIIKGDMSVIGPRPERPELYSVICQNLKEFNLRLACKPGLSGWAQVNYPYGASVHDARVKLMFDLFYIKNASLIFDLRIAMRTLIAMVKGAR